MDVFAFALALIAPVTEFQALLAPNSFRESGSDFRFPANNEVSKTIEQHSTEEITTNLLLLLR